MEKISKKYLRGRDAFLDPMQIKKYQNNSRCDTDYDQKVIWP